MVSALVPGSSGLGLSPGRGTLCCVLGQDTCWGVTCDGLASRPGRVEILLAASCYGNQDKLWPNEPVLAPKASLHFMVNSEPCILFLKSWQDHLLT